MNSPTAGFNRNGRFISLPQHLQHVSEPLHFAPVKMQRGEQWATGTLKSFNVDKGFGFLSPDNGNADIFVHISALQASGLQTLREGQKVSFDTEPDKRGKGPRAVKIQRESA